jgi:Glycosyltransferase family 87
MRSEWSSTDSASHRWLYRAGLALSVSYCAVAGAIGQRTPLENGVDLAVCYTAGVTSMAGASPYNYAELTRTHRSLKSGIAAKPSYTFAYPPSAVPACLLLSLLPWDMTQGLWKLLNFGFLIGSVILTFRLFPHLQFTPADRYAAWIYAFALSPTVTVLLVGQSSLFVLLTLLLAVILSRQGKTSAAGVSLALALTKPQLSFPILCLWLSERRFKAGLVALATFAVLCVLGLYLSNSTVETFVHGFRTHSNSMDPTNPRLVGIQNLATGVFGLSASTGSGLSLVVGLLSIGALLRLHHTGARHLQGVDLIAPLLVVGVLAFRAHSYDMVFLIPTFIWSTARAHEDRRFAVVLVLCLLLIIPLRAVELLYQNVLIHAIPEHLFQVAMVPFRSWILLTVFVLQLYWLFARTSQQQVSPAPPGQVSV